LETKNEDVTRLVHDAQKSRRDELRNLAHKKQNAFNRKRSLSTKTEGVGVMGTAAAATASTRPSQPASSSSKRMHWEDELMKLEVEDNPVLVCAVCMEGYRSKPTSLLLAYEHQKHVPLPVGSPYMT